MFQSYINNLILDYLDIFCTAYLDDVLVYSNTPKEHTKHVLKVLCWLLDRGLYININKCEFSVKEVKYLGLIMSIEGVKIDPKKVKVILTWETPQLVKDVQAFLGFYGFYQRFIKAFSQLTQPLNKIMKGSKTYITKTGKRRVCYQPFKWNPKHKVAFQALKQAFIKAPVLAHFNPNKETWVKTDVSDFVTTGVLSQMYNGELCLVAFFLKKMAPAETNYIIYNKELLAII
jgi:hypothetical protein